MHAPETRRSRRARFLSSLRGLILAAIVVFALVTLPLRQRPLPVDLHHSSLAIHGDLVERHHSDATSAGSAGAKDEPVLGDVVPVIVDGRLAGRRTPVDLGTGPIEVTPELRFTFPSAEELDRLFTTPSGSIMNTTHRSIYMQPTDVPSHERRRYQNPYTALKANVRRCEAGAHAQGRWVYDRTLKPKYPSYGEILGCCQRGFEKQHGPDAIRPELQYRWVADDCDLFEWNEELFCRALRGRDVMMAGDSLTDHWHASLYYLLGGRKDIYKREGTVRGKKACGTHEICHKYYPKPLRLYFLTNQLLQEERRLFRNYKWWKYIRGYPILILNAGSWMRDPADETRIVSDDEYFRHMKKAYAIVRKLYNGTVIWRTTYQGHPYCWEYTEPLTKELGPEDFPRIPPYLRYRWWAIPYRNNFTTQLWRQGGAHILDVSRITNLMPLGHLSKYHPKFEAKNTTDCLHYCSPGPIYDTWSMLLMNLLLGNLIG